MAKAVSVTDIITDNRAQTAAAGARVGDATGGSATDNAVQIGEGGSYSFYNTDSGSTRAALDMGERIISNAQRAQTELFTQVTQQNNALAQGTQSYAARMAEATGSAYATAKAPDATLIKYGMWGVGILLAFVGLSMLRK